MTLRLLARIGLIRIETDGKVRWPIHSNSWDLWKIFFLHPFDRGWGWFGVFRNRPGVIKWEQGRLLPRRWGIRIIGLEIGDRG
jgi:hypothetical protein